MAGKRHAGTTAILRDRMAVQCGVESDLAIAPRVKLVEFGIGQAQLAQVIAL